VDADRDTPQRKAAIVTAAGKGMGAACARELAARGYSLALMSRSEEATDLARELGGVGLEGSVTEEADLRTLVDKTLDAYGCVDAVVNSTGHPPTGDILAITDEEWHAGLDLVVLNVVRMARLEVALGMGPSASAASAISSTVPTLSVPELGSVTRCGSCSASTKAASTAASFFPSDSAMGSYTMPGVHRRRQPRSRSRTGGQETDPATRRSRERRRVRGRGFSRRATNLCQLLVLLAPQTSRC
jgi:NAD(P)-dependent dehydrogenase (short-subunit alcohol dehydrogenase family)